MMGKSSSQPWTQVPVLILIAVTFVSSATVWAAVPYLPVYLTEEVRDFPATWVGVVVAASALGTLAGQYPMARLASRISIRTFIVAAFVVEGISMAGVLFAAQRGGMAALVIILALRFVAGVSRAGIAQSVRAAIRKVSSTDQRAEVFGLVGSAEIAGITLGTFLAGLVAARGVGTVFLAGALACAVCIPLSMTLPAKSPADMESDDAAAVPTVELRSIARPLTVLLLLTASTTVLIGAYNSAWGPFLRDRGASESAVGILFALFTIPYIVLAPAFGRWANTNQRRRIAIVVGTALAVLAALSYPFIAWLPMVIVVELIAASGSAAAEPSLEALVSEMSADEDAQSRIFGITGTVSSALSAGASIVAGLMMTTNVGLPFFVLGLVAALALIGGVALLASTSRTRKDDHAQQREPETATVTN